MGKFAGETGQADCALAEAGYYVAEEGAAEQIPCAAGTYASGQGSSECAEANAGFFVPSDGASRPQQCPAGKFLGTSGARECEDCYARRGGGPVAPPSIRARPRRT